MIKQKIHKPGDFLYFIGSYNGSSLCNSAQYRAKVLKIYVYDEKFCNKYSNTICDYMRKDLNEDEKMGSCDVISL